MFRKVFGLALVILAAFSFSQDETKDEIRVKAHKVWVNAVSHGDHKVVVRGDHHGDREVVKVVVDGEVLEYDYSDLDLGETKVIETESGKTMELLRSEDGLVLNTGETEILLLDAGDEPDALGHVMAFGDGSDFALAEDIDFVGADDVSILGLGDLDQAARDAIIQAIREAGVEKEIHFAPDGLFGGKGLLHFQHPGAYGIFSGDNGTTVRIITDDKDKDETRH